MTDIHTSTIHKYNFELPVLILLECLHFILLYLSLNCIGLILLLLPCIYLTTLVTSCIFKMEIHVKTYYQLIPAN